MAAQGARLPLTRILVWSGLFCVVGGAAIVMGSLITTDFNDPEQAGKFLTQTRILEDLEPESSCHAEAGCPGTQCPAATESFSYTPLVLSREANPAACAAEDPCGKEHACPLSKLGSTIVAQTERTDLSEKSAQEIVRELTQGGPVSEELKPLVDEEIVLGSVTEIPHSTPKITQSRETLWDRNDPIAAEVVSDRQQTTMVRVSDPKTYKSLGLKSVQFVQSLFPLLERSISHSVLKTPTAFAEAASEKECSLSCPSSVDLANQTNLSQTEREHELLNSNQIEFVSATADKQVREEDEEVFGTIVLEPVSLDSISPLRFFAIQATRELNGLRSLGYGILINDLDERVFQTGKKIASHEKPLHRQSEPNEHFPAREEGIFFKSVSKAAFESENESENCPTPIGPTPISPVAESIPGGCPKAMHLRRAADELDKAGMADKAADLRKQADDVQAAFEAEEMRNRPVQVTGGQVEELKKTLAELREEVKQLKQIIEGLKEQFTTAQNERSRRTPQRTVGAATYPDPVPNRTERIESDFADEVRFQPDRFPLDDVSLPDLDLKKIKPLTDPKK